MPATMTFAAARALYGVLHTASETVTPRGDYRTTVCGQSVHYTRTVEGGEPLTCKSCARIKAQTEAP